MHQLQVMPAFEMQKPIEIMMQELVQLGMYHKLIAALALWLHG
jgi:hypothetical protein